MKRLACISFIALLSSLISAQIPSSLIGPDGQFTRGTGFRPQFHSISVSSAADIKIVLGFRNAIYKDGERVKASRVERGTMHLDDVGDYKIVVTDLRMISVNGAADIEYSDIKCESLKVEVKGACDAWLSGRVNKLVINVRGAADVFASDLRARSAKVSIQGAGDLHLWVTGRLDVSIKGAGDIVYRGDPWKVVSDVKGAGDITKRN